MVVGSKTVPVSSSKESGKVDFAEDTMDTMPPATRSLKRPLAPSEILVPRKKIRNDGSSVLHTPLSILNQLMPGLEYTIDSVSGPSHCPRYEISVQVDGTIYRGSGIGKQQGKQKTAEAVLYSLYPDMMAQYSIPPEITAPDPVPEENDTSNTPAVSDLANFTPQRQVKLMRKADEALAGKINPLAVLNEILHSVKFDCLSDNSGPFSKFAYSFSVDGASYKGTGNSKKAAKCAAARAYLSYRFGTGQAGTPVEGNRPATAFTFPLLSPPAADAIANMVLGKYESLTGEMGEYMKRKVIAGMVMTIGADLSSGDSVTSNGMVVALATGTKTISGEHISESGSVLNDSHAEIVTRRGTMAFLYSELEKLATREKAESSIFEVAPNRKGFCMKSNVKFHLYINTAPCGDARIFSPHEVADGQVADRHPNRQSRGQLRTKIESGEGTIPVKPKEVLTWDAVVQGQRLLTMSCSDKVLKWNILGLQGSLLSHYIAEPIYISSLVVSSLLNEPHLYRALAGRVEPYLTNLPQPYQINKHFVNKTTSPEPRIPSKAPNHSVNWITGESGVEIVNTMTGSTVAGGASRLCKRNMAARFHKLLSLGLPSCTGITQSKLPALYCDVKAAAKHHHNVKQQFFDCFPKGKLGTWVKKPIEQDQFPFSDAVM